MRHNQNLQDTEMRSRTNDTSVNASTTSETHKIVSATSQSYLRFPLSFYHSSISPSPYCSLHRHSRLPIVTRFRILSSATSCVFNRPYPPTESWINNQHDLQIHQLTREVREHHDRWQTSKQWNAHPVGNTGRRQNTGSDHLNGPIFWREST